MTTGPGAAIYVRQSLDRNGEGAAVARQEAECRELAKSQGWNVERVYVDNDKSATSARPRPAWTELLADLEAGRYSVLICWHTDRLYRRLRDLVDLVEIAERRALLIKTVRAAELDLSTPAGRMMAAILGSAARYEVEQKSARQVTANKARAQQGNVGWTRRPFGYRRAEDGTVMLDDAEAGELRQAAGAVLAGASLSSIVRDLDARGVTTSLGGTWSVTSLRRALLNPRNSGRAVSLGHDYGRGAWTPVFDEATADRLRAVVTDPRRRTTSDNTAKYLLSGMAICGICGASMYATPAGSPTGGQWQIYRCPTTHLARRLDLVDEVVVETVIARLSQPDAAALFAPASASAVEALRTELVDLRARRDGLADLIAEGLLPPAAAREQAGKLGARIGELEDQMQRAESASPAAALTSSTDVSAAWAALPLKSQRDVIRSLMTVTIEKAGRGARFEPEQVQIKWKNP